MCPSHTVPHRRHLTEPTGLSQHDDIDTRGHGTGRLCTPSRHPTLATTHLPPQLSPYIPRTAGGGFGSLSPAGTMFPLRPRLRPSCVPWGTFQAAGGHSPTKGVVLSPAGGLHRSTWTHVGLFSTHGAALLWDGHSGTQLRAERFPRVSPKAVRSTLCTLLMSFTRFVIDQSIVFPLSGLGVLRVFQLLLLGQTCVVHKYSFSARWLFCSPS